MEIEENEGGGTSVLLEADDKLIKIPKSHRHLLTRKLREIFPDPPRYLRQIAENCTIPPLKTWLEVLAKEGIWNIGLHQGDPPEWTEGVMEWYCSSVYSGILKPAAEVIPPHMPEEFRSLYTCVDGVSWMPFGCSGGIYSSRGHLPLSEFYLPSEPTNFDPSKAWVYGDSTCGDMLIYTNEGISGWWSHESGELRVLGTIKDTIEWVFGELRSNRVPEIDFRS